MWFDDGLNGKIFFTGEGSFNEILIVGEENQENFKKLKIGEQIRVKSSNFGGYQISTILISKFNFCKIWINFLLRSWNINFYSIS